MAKSITLTALGLAGFIFACFLFFFKTGNTKSHFHEIGYDPRLKTGEMLDKKRDSILEKVRYDLKFLDSIESDKKYKDSKPKTAETKGNKRGINIDSLKAKIKEDTLLLMAINTNYFRLTDNDSALAKNADENLKIVTSLDSLYHFDTLVLRNDTVKQIYFNFTFYDPELKGIGEIHKTLPLPINNFGSDVDLFTKYPTFGVWALLILLYCSAAAMIIGLCIYTANGLSDLKEGKQIEGSLSYWKSFAICFILLALFVVAIDLTFYDGDALKDLYFMKGLAQRFEIVSVLGYTAVAFCFAGMIGTASLATYFKTNIEDPGYEKAKAQVTILQEIKKLEMSLTNETDAVKKESLTMNLKIKKDELAAVIQSSIRNDIKRLTDEIKELEGLPAPGTEAAQKEKIEKEKEKRDKLNSLNIKLDKAVNDYTDLQKLFRKYLYAIAILLAFLVFCTGTLYSAVDNLAFIKMLKSDMGFSPAPHEFVYLYGALHTGLILLFYLPAQLQLPRYKVKTPDPVTEEEPKKGFLKGKGFGGELKKITDVLLIGAPILAGFAQWLLNLIFEN